MDRRIREVVCILTRLIFQPHPCNFEVTHDATRDDGKRKRDRKLLEDVAKAVSLSPSYLSRLFRAKMKMTLKQ
jgi:AraC-like DNA-binding protein